MRIAGVRLQLALGLEVFFAYLAEVGFSGVVHTLHMFLQVGKLCERSRAEYAGKWFFTRVRPHVNLASRRVSERRSTDLTFVGAFSGMNSHMDSQLGVLCEGGTASRTLVRSHT